jgi:hypothetical protein
VVVTSHIDNPTHGRAAIYCHPTNSPGRVRRTAVWISWEDRVDFFFV